MQLTTEQLAKLLLKSRHESTRSQKRYLLELGGNGSTFELDAMLLHASRNREVLEHVEKLKRQLAPLIAAPETVASKDILAQLRDRLQQSGISEQELASRCGWSQSQLTAALAGDSPIDLAQLSKLATGLKCHWQLMPCEDATTEAKTHP